MWLVKLSDFMMMPGPPPPFEVLSYRNMLTEWQPGFFVIFVSHQWLGRDHPDEEGHVCHCLRMALQNIMTESLVVDYDPLAKSLGFSHKLSKKVVGQMMTGYLWMDWMCLPQDHLDSRLEQCMPLFVERCPIFVILAPKLHNSQGELCSYQSYGRRGWCRAEIWFKQMRTKPQDMPMILITGGESVKFLRAHNWVYNMVHDGLFSVPGDRELLKPVMETLMKRKLEEFLLQGKMHYFRYFKSRLETVANLGKKSRSFEEFLADFHFDEKSLRGSFGLGAVACAVLSGDLQLLPTLVEKGAKLRCRAPNMLEIDILPGMTPLQLAAKHSCDRVAIQLLLELRADINETDSLGTSVLGHAGTPEVVELLIERKADVNQRKGPFGLPALSACILRPLAPEGIALMIDAQADVNVGRGMYCFSPLSTTTLYREMPMNTETCWLLLNARADVNYREGFYTPLNLFARLLMQFQRKPSPIVDGIAGCNGATPLYISAWFGNPEMVNLLLQAGADPELRNCLGRSYLEALNINCFNCGATSMSWELQGPKRWVSNPEALFQEWIECGSPSRGSERKNKKSKQCQPEPEDPQVIGHGVEDDGALGTV